MSFNFLMQSPRRAALHAPLGVLNALLLNSEPAIGWALLVLFLAYEVNEDWRITDEAFKDIQGHLAGLAIAGAVVLILGAL
jgi:hypothetical protein